ncbi:hypothetical protein Ocepr_1800 [Oceanithermus profundus DSM 14977]|uniref:Uncharacterized protein n=1 Tax=Oceanithermus profundus (strain DSM 14977 / NBRC 100410 / VKM B-2274 / 506) TaxID=670487 RepID=E4U9T8_OCEP5|nr:hypothetical protein [Oceanithermus profundus]ADR37252.1 hypothetical protein Ocepr_1800 [Oceanithermus profundus DSM 14977]
MKARMLGVGLVLLMAAFAQVTVQPVADPGLIDDDTIAGFPLLTRMPWDREAYRLQLDRPRTVTVEYWLNGRKLGAKSKAFEAGPLVVATGYRLEQNSGCSLFWSVTMKGADAAAQKIACLEIAPIFPPSLILRGALPDAVEPGQTYLLAWLRYTDALSRTGDLVVTLVLE